MNRKRKTQKKTDLRQVVRHAKVILPTVAAGLQSFANVQTNPHVKVASAVTSAVAAALTTAPRAFLELVTQLKEIRAEIKTLEATEPKDIKRLNELRVVQDDCTDRLLTKLHKD